MKKQLVILTAFVLISLLLNPVFLSAQENAKPPKFKAEQLVGKWKATRAEVLNVPPVADAKQAPAPVDTSKRVSNQGRPVRSTDAVAEREKRNLENFLYYEAKSSLEIFANKTLVKKYNEKIINATWKLKKNSLTAKDIKTKEKYKIKISKCAPDLLIVEETSKTGNVTVKVIYEKEK